MNRRSTFLTALLALASAATLTFAAPCTAAPTPAPTTATASVTHHRRINIEGVELFYREAGPADAPVVVLLHGFPSSSHMFRRLIPALADRYHVIAPDYPGFGQSAMPDRAAFAYGFAHFAELTDGLIAALGATRYALYVNDYGAPIGYRLALRHPERVTALVVQNGNAYDEGLREFWAPIKAYWAEGTPQRRDALRAGMTLEATRFQYLDGVRDASRIAPESWLVDQALLERPGNAEIQLDLFKDYGSNVALYPQFQRYFREHQPPTLIVWGRNDKIFQAEGAHLYLRDLPRAELHLLDSGHFALEDQSDEIARLMRDFLDRTLARR